ncbi:MAG: UDP-N-acetylmuramate dehydrogenase [Gemmatimonadaceae bacterium]|nr:UDP-N-acetylmuramate dehydrogenase [Gemmatimonadaceae bacterium]
MVDSSSRVSDIVGALAPALGADRLRRGVPLAPYTTFKIGGPADVLYDATSADELASAVTAARHAGVPHFVLGLGANILVGDGGVRGLVIRNRAERIAVRADGRVTAESGATVAALIREAVAAGWSGLEHYVGIPSTVGGAVWQNLHFLSPAPERERTMFIAEVVREVELLLPDESRQRVDAASMQFGYDTSRLHGSGEVALTVEFALERGEQSTLQRILQENLAWRGARHPWLEYHPSAGSIFKKIEGVGAGRLVDQCGLKGHRIGNAQISHMHANIIVNLGDATAADVRALIAHAQAAVADRFGQQLEPEIGFVGDFSAA